LVFVLFVVGLLVPTIASARTPGYAGTRVGAFDLAVHVGVGLSVDQAAEKHHGIGFTCDEAASGSPHAAEGVASGGGASAPMQIVRTIGRGEKIADIVAEGKSLTFTTGNEHALVKLASGERAIVSGGPGGITWEAGEVTRVFGHTHPYQLPPTGPSPADFGMLDVLGQRSSWLLEHGQLTRFRVGGP
jgi:hypothetical protein